MNNRRFAVLFFFAGAFIVPADGQEAQTDWPLQPFWSGSLMERESVLFIAEEGEPGAAQLLFHPKTILKIERPSTGETFVEGEDFTVDREAGLLRLTTDSAIPFKTAAEMTPPLGQGGQAHRDGTRDLFFGEGHLFHDLQIEVTYEHAPGAWQAMDGSVPEAQGDNLPRTTSKLAAGEPLRIALLGDSISAGGNASGVVGAPPHMPAYGQLVAEALEAQHGSETVFMNFSVGGKTSVWGMEEAAKVGESKPDLAIIAFGMNDASQRRSPEEFAANTQQIMDTIRATNPDAEFVLVAGMTGNEDWKHSAPELYPAYRDALMALKGEGVAVADVTSIWIDMLKRKRFTDLTGNGVNHPNDFGHRVYAQVILATLE